MFIAARCWSAALYRAINSNMSDKRKQKKEKIEIELVDRPAPRRRPAATKAQRKPAKTPNKSGRMVPSMSDAAAVNVTRSRMGVPIHRELTPSLASQNTLAHMMSILNPWDPKYNGAKVPNPAPVDSAIFKTHEIIVAGTPTASENNTAGMVFTGFGGFVMRPNTLGRQYAYTQGSAYLGWDITDASAGGLVAYSLEGSGQYLIFNMVGQEATQAVPMPNADPNQPAWMSPFAMDDIIQLCSKYRVVSAGLVARYIGPAITGSGMIAAGSVPYTQLETVNIDPIGASNPFPYLGLNWTTFVNLKDVVTGPADQGINMIYVPKDARATEWKQTVLSFPLPDGGELPGLLRASSRAVARARKRGTLHKLVQNSGRMAGVQAELTADGKVKITHGATFTKTIDAEGKVVARRARIDPLGSGQKSTSSTQLGTVVDNNLFMIPWFHGNENPLAGEAVLLQPEDTEAGLAAVFAQAAFAAYNMAGPSATNAPSADDVNQLLNIYADSSWSEAEDLMVLMWNGIAPADAVLAAGATSSWAGNLFEIDKYVNYEAILDLNALDIGSMPASPGSFGSPSAGPAISKQIRPTTALVGKPKKSESWLDKAGDWLSNAKDKVEPWISAGSKAIQVATAIADVIGSFI